MNDFTDAQGATPPECIAFDRWLDEAEPDASAATMRTHADTCARCHEAQAAMAAVESWLTDGEPAPQGFTDHVMTRIAKFETARRTPAVAPDVMPWWIQLALQPTTILAAVLAAVVVSRPDALTKTFALAMTATTQWSIDSATFVQQQSATTSPNSDAVLVGVLLAVLSLVVPLAVLLGRWVSRFIVQRAA